MSRKQPTGEVSIADIEKRIADAIEDEIKALTIGQKRDLLGRVAKLIAVLTPLEPLTKGKR